MTLIDFQDAVTASNLDPNQTHAVFYADGAFANRTAVAARCPHAKLYGITVSGITGQGIFACDSETGDLTVAQTITWVAEQVALGVELICVYANLDRWLNGGLLAALAKYGKRIRRWVAHYNNVRAIESWADAEQYADPGPIDRNVALANFFGDAAPVDPLHYERFDNRPRKVLGKWRRERPQVELYDRLRERQTPRLHPRRAQLNFVRLVLAWYARRLRVVAIKQGWDGEWRQWRYDQLTKRRQGKRVA